MKITVFGEGARCRVYEITKEQANQLRHDPRVGRALWDGSSSWSSEDAAYTDQLFEQVGVKVILDQVIYFNDPSCIYIEDPTCQWGSQTLSLTDLIEDFGDKIKREFRCSFQHEPDFYAYSMNLVKDTFVYESANQRESFRFKKLIVTSHEIDFDAIGSTVDSYGGYALNKASSESTGFHRRMFAR